ncbi:alpha-E domain-containing protein [Rhodopila sp.]|uniref:alpha-E domain-containing protein n=1 Tax=Rhodopila sp. TaxID=2480087 RepID=UPI002C782B2F|nr:alpha-E domain-containing protein [Rhodopila sp.]HVZ08644.1 alpha-E domain-containing protein [Rhodopila sp.]
MDTLPKQRAIHLIARHAESTLWLARYMERIENTARILDVTNTFARDADDTQNWLSIPRINGDLREFTRKHPQATQRSVGEFYLLDSENPSSVQSCIACARENARTLRALISTEMWLQINVFHGYIKALTPSSITADHFTNVCATLKEGTQEHTGVTEGTFYRDQAWHFYMIGRSLERADQTTRLLDTRFHSLAPQFTASDADLDAGHWNALLRAAAGYHAYRREHPNGYVPMEVAGFLLANTAFPRSVGLNLGQIGWHMTQLRTRYGLRRLSKALERLEDLNAAMTYPNVLQLGADKLSPFLDFVQGQIAGLHGDVVETLGL